jgi:hypothetical protein
MSKVVAAATVLAVTVWAAARHPEVQRATWVGRQQRRRPSPQVQPHPERLPLRSRPLSSQDASSAARPFAAARRRPSTSATTAVVLTRNRGGAWQQTVTMSDPRLEGTVYHTFEGDTYRAAGAEQGPEMFAATCRIANEQGAWGDRGYGGSYSDGTPIGENSPDVWIGEGAYEGMIAVMESTPLEGGGCGASLRGVIFTGAPALEPYIPR